MYLTMLWTHVTHIDPDLPDGTKGRMDESRESMMAAVEIRAGNKELQPYYFLFESCKFLSCDAITLCRSQMTDMEYCILHQSKICVCVDCR